MSGLSPASVLYSSDGYELAVVTNTTIPIGTRGLLVTGSDGTNARPILIDSSGRQIVAGAGTAGTPTGGVLTIQGVASGTAVTISGTVTANLGTIAGVATEASLAKLTITQGTALGTNTVTMMGGSVTTSAPTYTTGQINALSLTTAGALRVDGSAVTQPVSGTITANAGTGNFTVAQATAANLNATVVGTTAAGSGASSGLITVQGNASGTPIPVSGTVTATNPSVSTTGSAPPASATYIGGSVTTAAPTYTTGQMSALSLTTGGLLRVDASGTTQTISGTVAATQSGTWNITNISGTISLPTGAATEASLVKLTLAQGSTTSGQTGPLVQGAVATSSPTYTNGQTSPLSLTTTGALRVETQSSDVHDAVAGTFVTMQGAYGSSTAPTAVSANGDAVRLWADLNGRLAIWDGASTISIDDASGSITVDGTVTANQGTANTAANGWFVKVTDGTNTMPTGDVVGRGIYNRITDGTNQAAVKAASTAAVAGDPALVVTMSPNTPGLSVITDKCATGTVTSVTAATSSTSLLASNANRVLATVFNESSAILYLKLGTTASVTSYTIKIFPGSYWELPASYTGAIDGIWSAAAGFARITELT